MKKSIILSFLAGAFILQSGCATIFYGKGNECQRTKPAEGQAKRQVRPGALVFDLIVGTFTFYIPVIIDFVNGAIYYPCDPSTMASKEDQKKTEPAPSGQPAPASDLPEQPGYRGNADPLKGLNVSKAKEMAVGHYYALIIGIDKYKGSWHPLQNAVNDAKAVEALLTSKYKFDSFRTLYNEQATRKSIIAQLEWLVQNVKETDNVFIFYSGHGEYKKELNKGFWVPVDATTNSTAEFISNNDLQTYLGGIKSKHTLLVSDACFSGDLFRGNTISVPFENSEKYYTQVHGLMSRQAFTSGGIEPVMDGGRDGHSVFTYYFLKALKENDNKYFDASQLYDRMKIPVVNNSDQTPKLAPLKDTGDEGGQFIFIKKQ